MNHEVTIRDNEIMIRDATPKASTEKTRLEKSTRADFSSGVQAKCPYGASWLAAII